MLLRGGDVSMLRALSDHIQFILPHSSVKLKRHESDAPARKRSKHAEGTQRTRTFFYFHTTQSDSGVCEKKVASYVELHADPSPDP